MIGIHLLQQFSHQIQHWSFFDQKLGKVSSYSPRIATPNHHSLSSIDSSKFWFAFYRFSCCFFRKQIQILRFLHIQLWIMNIVLLSNPLPNPLWFIKPIKSFIFNLSIFRNVFRKSTLPSLLAVSTWSITLWSWLILVINNFNCLF